VPVVVVQISQPTLVLYFVFTGDEHDSGNRTDRPRKQWQALSITVWYQIKLLFVILHSALEVLEGDMTINCSRKDLD